MAENSPKFRVLIAGAGIAGLATAIALSRISNVPNLDIQLYEQAPELTEIGASIALSPNVCGIPYPAVSAYYQNSSCIRACELWRSSACTMHLQTRMAFEGQAEYRK